MEELRPVTYCGFYCGLCAERSRIPNQARALRDTVVKEGYDFWGQDLPNFREFRAFLERMCDPDKNCPGCRQGGGSPVLRDPQVRPGSEGTGVPSVPGLPVPPDRGPRPGLPDPDRRREADEPDRDPRLGRRAGGTRPHRVLLRRHLLPPVRGARRVAGPFGYRAQGTRKDAEEPRGPLLEL